ncbi:methyl-CpG-binding domain-containing protein 7 isoform X1 [Nicotiana tabacum]|uniref:Methyl-CpG-binding domain-containing protein 7 isoform X1 n=1 Tax=Nicotiana tabacum TaxID=4097 RepID=A0A1S3ZD88_TOBAC|nr:PREDICTED: methyl-CpG-binding domain-containing protein 7-like isoform X1 [Nicotiana tabacum]
MPPSGQSCVCRENTCQFERMVVPIPPTRRHRSGAEYSTYGQLMVVPPTTTASTYSSSFKLPPGWGVQEVPRSDGCRVDKYYYEPGTGLKFRSLREVERRLNGEIFAPRSRALVVRHNQASSSLSQKMVVYGGKIVRMDEEQLNQWAIVPSRNAATLPYELPDGWVIEEVPRRDGSFVDKYYYEPGTGQKFRSRIAAQRYLAEMREDVPLSATLEELKENKPLSKMFKLHHQTKKSVPCKRNISGEDLQKSSFLSPPAKVNWVLSSPKGDAWDPFLAGTPIPDSVKQQWTKRFMLFMNDETLNAENSD